MKSIALALVLIASPLAASAETPAQPSTAPAALPSGHPSTTNVMAMLPPPIPKLTQEGKVLSVINAAGYTYVEVQLGKKTQWIAAQPVVAEKGNTILFDDGAAMADFYSKTLNRTFPSITFVSNVGVCHTK